MNVADSHTPTIFADIAVDTTGLSGNEAVFTYSIPDTLIDRLAVGQLVWVPLRRKVSLGIVVELHARQPDFDLRLIMAAVEPTFCLTQDQFELAEWLSRETVSTFFASAAPFLPPGVAHRAVEQVRLRDEIVDMPADLPKPQQRIVDALLAKGPLTIAAMTKYAGRQAKSAVAALESAGLVERYVAVVDRAPAARGTRVVELVQPDMEAVARAPRQRAVLDALVQRRRIAQTEGPNPIPLDELLQLTGVDATVIGALERKGLVKISQAPRDRGPSRAPGSSPPVLTKAQGAAWRVIEEALRRRDPTPILLHGVTGSGKTELYLRAVAWCLRQRRQAIILVPEITLATQMVRRVQARFPGLVRVLHSDLSDADRYATWQEIESGIAQVVVGPRSALFAPVADLGLIVLDEEHEPAYKQESEPRYHARSLAAQRAEQHGAVVLLGSATPAVESYYDASMERMHLLSLPDRVTGAGGGIDAPHSWRSAGQPDVEIVDMRVSLQTGGTPIVSDPLRELLQRALDRREQAILLLNRRGMATVVLCRQCGASINCPHCDVPMVYHQDRNRLICHRCNAKRPPPNQCPICNGPLDYFGAGTQRVEREARELFPGARVARLDRDSVRRKGGHEAIISAIERREVDLVVGTQMVAKGFDFPFVTAVGVIHADTVLHLPDFRSGERTFQLLTQVAGRAGRRHLSGRVIIQTYTPRHYAIQAAARHDYEGFYAEEITFRERNRYPPFTRLARFSYRHESEMHCEREADQLAMDLSRHLFESGIEGDLLGPAPAFAAKVRDKYQWQIVLRIDADAFEAVLDGLPVRPGWVIDVDPQSLL